MERKSLLYCIRTRGHKDGVKRGAHGNLGRRPQPPAVRMGLSPYVPAFFSSFYRFTAFVFLRVVGWIVRLILMAAV